MIRRLSLVAVALLALSSVALATTASTKRNSKTVTLKAGAVKTVNVPYPDALKFGHSHYKGKIRVVGQTGAGVRARPSKLKVLSKGSAVGGSVFRAKLKNTNVKGTRALRVRVTAITTEP